MSSDKKLLLIELNEFNLNLLRSATRQMSLPFIEKVLTFSETQTSTDDRYESGYLEPWVQWVSIHTGTPSTVHKIKHLGDVPTLGVPQIWENLDPKGVSSGIWGVMNGSRRDCRSCRFFLPDPWTFSENGFPKELNNLLDLPRYISKNYLGLSKIRIVLDTIKLLGFLIRSGAFFMFLKELPFLISSIFKYGPKHFVFISFFDYVSAYLFVTYKRAYQPRFSLIFLNSIAHLQHHHWTQGENNLTPPLRFGLSVIDRVLKMLINCTSPNEAIVVLNALSQMNTNHEKPWILFRQKNPETFLQAVKLPFERIEQLMTKDAHVFFKSTEDCELTFKALSEARVNGVPAFYVERDSLDAKKLFYRLEYTDVVDLKTRIEINSQSWKFLDLFDEVVLRTGRHIPVASAFSRGIELPSKLKNHELNKIFESYFE